ncbi:MAG: site-2 protease family protein [Actinomycetota bacterium]|nr:site-2 protease family protein [Actinomycetota bacterium]
MSYALAFLGFAALIILHEAGHFAVAKAVGMRVERFSLFFGPMLVKFRRGETEYGIGPIPLGGYVKITGMNPNEPMPAEARPRAYYNQKVWKRVVVILAGPAVNLIIAFGILMALYVSHGEVVTRHGQPVYSQRPVALRAPASRYLKAGDEIVAVDGRRGLTVPQITRQIASHRCPGVPVGGCAASTPVQIVVRRAGQLLSFRIDPRYDPAHKRTLVGFSFPALTEPVSAGVAASASLSYMWYVTRATVSRIVRVLEPQDRKQIHGVVGGYTVTQQYFARDTTRALEVLALISLSLAVVNLFPFLPLDGGHVFWAVAEKLRGRRIPFAIMERAGVVGFALVLVLFVIGLSNDISTLTGPGFGVR